MITGLLPDTHTVGEHYDAAMTGRWCECIPQSAIDVINHWQHAYMRGYNLNEPEDQKRWETDTYGRHDIEFVGFMARRYAVERIGIYSENTPKGVVVHMIGRHRCNSEENVSFDEKERCARTKLHMQTTGPDENGERHYYLGYCR